MNPTHWSNLEHRDDRTVARIARIAINNTVFGGWSALGLAKRLAAMGGQDVQYVVSDVYSASTGRDHPEHSAWECPECGSAYLGQESARRCCEEQDDSTNEDINEITTFGDLHRTEEEKAESKRAEGWLAHMRSLP